MTTYVQVMVPEEHLATVYRILASSLEPEIAGSDGAVRDAVPPASGGWWDPTFVQTHLGGRSETIRALAKYLADRPGRAVTADEAAAGLRLRHGWNSLAGALGAFGNYLANRGLAFPWSTTTDARDARVRMTMDDDIAAAVRRVL